MFAPFPNKKYQIIYADPPWFYNERIGETDNYVRGAQQHYRTVRLADLKALPISDIADQEHCLIFLWATSPMIADAIEMGNHWGFKYITVGFIWHKQLPVVGNYTMSECEFVLIFKKGRIPKPRGARNIRQFLSKTRTKHSEKPPEIRDRIHAMFPEQDKIELFARHKVDGWDVWGNEVGKLDRLPASNISSSTITLQTTYLNLDDDG